MVTVKFNKRFVTGLLADVVILEETVRFPNKECAGRWLSAVYRCSREADGVLRDGQTGALYRIEGASIEH